MTDRNERVSQVAPLILDAIQTELVKYQVSHAEYRQVCAWLGELAVSGELPLFLDVFFESVVERITFEGRPGSEGTVQGPYYLPSAPEITRIPLVLSMREAEPGVPTIFKGCVQDTKGQALPQAEVELWQAGNDGTYSGFVGDAPANNLRGRMYTDSDGAFVVRTVRPAPYEIPKAGPTGAFLSMVGRPAWRPAHFHFKVSARGFDTLTTQLYLKDDPLLGDDGDVVGAVKDSLIIESLPGKDQSLAAAFGIEGEHEIAEYTFRLRPAG
jgi:catechol 1,2-dioxygenase